MNFCSASVVILLLASFVSLPYFNNASFLSDACSKAAANNSDINGGFCLTSLQADPKSASANLTGLLNISINLAIENATETVSHIKYLLLNSMYAHIKDDLSSCQDKYSDAINCLSDAVNQIRSSSSDDYNNAKNLIIEAMTSVENCEDETINKSILSEEHANAVQLCAMAFTFLNKDNFS